MSQVTSVTKDQNYTSLHQLIAWSKKLLIFDIRLLYPCLWKDCEKVVRIEWPGPCVFWMAFDSGDDIWAVCPEEDWVFRVDQISNRRPLLGPVPHLT